MTISFICTQYSGDQEVLGFSLTLHFTRKLSSGTEDLISNRNIANDSLI